MPTKAVDGLPVKGAALAVNAQDAMKNVSKKFIGAVEDEWQLYSDCATDYTIGAPIGFGASSIVYAATYTPSSPLSSSPSKSSKPIPCALKVLDLDSLPPRSLQLLQRETTLMSLSKHPNVLRVRGSWMDGHKLYVALRLMNKGSAADVMRYGWPGGMEEDVVRCILMQALKGLNYLHINGFIHRDVKAANLLIDDDGTVLLGDLGVAADLSEDTSRSPHPPKPYSVTATAALPQSRSVPAYVTGTGKRNVAFDEPTPGVSRPTIGKRKSFVGTPCWMAPELIQGRQYDSSADIWSFGITAIELTQGRPPRSRESPQKVLLRTIQEDSPTLNREGGVYKYSRAFKDIVDSCLVKDPSKRPTAEELLQTPFFKASKKPSYLVNTILKDLPPLTQRQERRVLPPPMSANSIDSWDFATTVHSPMTSVFRRHALEEMVSAEDERPKVTGVFEMEDELSPSSSRNHSRVVSWVGKAVEEDIPERDEEIVPLSSSSPSTSESSVLSSNIAPSSFPPDTSVSSSYTNPSEIEHKMQAASVQGVPNSGNDDQPGAPISEYSGRHPTLVGLDNVLPVSASAPVVKSTEIMPASSSSGTTLWGRLKSTSKKPSRTDLSSPSGDVTQKDKDKGKIGGILSNASRGLLSRSSNRPMSSGSKETK